MEDKKHNEQSSVNFGNIDPKELDKIFAEFAKNLHTPTPVIIEQPPVRYEDIGNSRVSFGQRILNLLKKRKHSSRRNPPPTKPTKVIELDERRG